VFELGQRVPHRFAALASVAGGAHPGFAHAPRTPRSEAGSLAVLDLHGKDDDSIPGGPADPQGGAKGWTSDGTWFYEPTATLLGAFGRWQGCVHDPAWGEDWASAVDAGSDALSCADWGSAGCDGGLPCPGCAMVVRCTWGGGHACPPWGGALAWRWFIEHPKQWPADGAAPADG